MYRLGLTVILPCLLFLSACKTDWHQKEKLPQDKSIQVYFNHRDTGKQTYSDPYRQIERGGDNLEATIIREIEGAKSSIDLAVQELNLPNIALALAKKHQAGVKVRVILENNYSRPLSQLTSRELKQLDRRDRLKYQEFMQLADTNRDRRLSREEINRGDAIVILHNSGIAIIDDTADGSKGSGLMHHKFMIIDDRKVLTGSANFTLSGIHGDFKHRETQGNVNHILTISNRQLADIFTKEFNYMWQDKQFGLAKPKRFPQTIRWDDTQITVHFSPVSPTQDWQDSSNGLISKAIANAKSSIDIALFVFSEQKIADILQQKQQQGVKIRAIFDPQFAFRYYSEALDMLGLSMKNNCRYESDNWPWTQPINSVGIPQLAMGDKFHHKFALIDNKIVVTGSQNWSQAANDINDETVLIIDNFKVSRYFQREFNHFYNLAQIGVPRFVSQKIDRQEKKCN